MDGVIRVANTTLTPVILKKRQEYARAVPLIEPPDTIRKDKTTTKPHKPKLDHEKAIQVDPAGQLTAPQRAEFLKVNKLYKDVFSEEQHVYNHAYGKFEAVINMGDVKPPQRKGRIPQYSRDRLEKLQAKFDQLETDGVSIRPEENQRQHRKRQPLIFG